MNGMKAALENSKRIEALKKTATIIVPENQPVRETDKAEAYEAVVCLSNYTGCNGSLVWFPKSQKKDGGYPAWMIASKIRETRNAVAVAGFEF